MPKSRPPTSPVRPRDAATLIVVRRGRRGLACLMGRRHEDARFLPGCFVFPGGAVEGPDRVARPASRLDLVHLGAMGVGGNAAAAAALATAAVRETWEETGVMIAAPGDIGAAPGATFDEMRRRGVAPALGRLVYLGRAITPVRHPIRFHARFFLTLAGDGRNGLRDDARGGGSGGDSFGDGVSGGGGLDIGDLDGGGAGGGGPGGGNFGGAGSGGSGTGGDSFGDGGPEGDDLDDGLDVGDLDGDGELDSLCWVPLADVASLPTIDVTRFMAGFAGEIIDSAHPRSTGRPVFSTRGPHRLIRYL